MKNLNFLVIALVGFALAGATFGQPTVKCDACTHELSVYMGDGGFVAEVDGDADMVSWLATCGGVTTFNELKPDDDGIVSMLFNSDNGLSCMNEKASLELGPVKDGGWFWITDDMHSAVGNLVSQDILEIEPIPITSAGDGVKMTMGKGAVYVKETSTGRVGILPNILAEPPAAPSTKCGPKGGEAAYKTQATKSCMLGAGGTKIRLVGPGSFGAPAPITNGMVYRPNAGTVEVTADLWLDGKGSYSTSSDVDTYLAADDPSDSETTAYLAAIRKGWGKPVGGAELAATFSANLKVTVGEGEAIPESSDGSVKVAGISETSATAATKATFRIASDPAYCSAVKDGKRENNHTAVVVIKAAVADTGNDIHPEPVAPKNGVELRVVCAPPASAAKTGQELVPENPFPVDWR